MKHIDVKTLKPGYIVEFDGVLQISPWGYPSINSGTGIGDYITIAPVKLSVVVPDGFNGIKAMVDVLDAKAEDIRTEAADKLQALAQQKNDLLQLSYAGQDILDAAPDLDDIVAQEQHAQQALDSLEGE